MAVFGQEWSRFAREGNVVFVPIMAGQAQFGASQLGAQVWGYLLNLVVGEFSL